MRKKVFISGVFLSAIIVIGLMIKAQAMDHQKLIQIAPVPGVSYDSCKKDIKLVKKNIKEAYDKKLVKEDSLAKLYTQIMLDRIIPYWYGTAWDFNGYTAIPRQGVVACGYFVSTTLQHSGIKLNRYKMAQKSSMDGALMLEPKDSLFIKYSSREEFLPVFQQRCKDGLYMVGLSFHVGFLYKSGQEVYFIHSSYLSPTCVVKEKASESEALGQSKVFVVADITYNRSLIKKWLNDEELKH
jgi:hypothetical protein